MKTKHVRYNYSSNTYFQNIKIEIPFLCPLCGVSNNPTNSHSNHLTYKDSLIAFFHHKCTACNELFFTTQLISDKLGKMVNLYPYSKNTQFSELISEMSPRFVELYNQAETAEDLNHIDLAGMGYRASLEVLIKDYALYFELDTKEDIAKLNLNNVIGKYFKNEDSIIPADVVRKLGNDFAHWDKEYDLQLSVLKTYLEIFVKQIEVKLMIKHPPVETRTPN